MEEVDWHHIAKERFANEIAEALYRHAHVHLFESLIIIDPPKIPGQLRTACHAEVVARSRRAMKVSRASFQRPIGRLSLGQRRPTFSDGPKHS